METICGIADCGCWYSAEEGSPCIHDIALAEELAEKEVNN